VQAYLLPAEYLSYDNHRKKSVSQVIKKNINTTSEMFSLKPVPYERTSSGECNTLSLIILFL
jgi:hypothetical protein